MFSLEETAQDASVGRGQDTDRGAGKPASRNGAQPAPGAPDVAHAKHSTLAVAGAAALVAACVAAALSVVVPSRAIIPGLPEADELTELLLPAVKALFDLMAAVTVGWLLGAAVLAPPQNNGMVGVGGFRALRAASLAAIVWAASGIALIPLTVADALGRPLSQSLGWKSIGTAMSALTALKAALICVVLALVIAVASRMVLRMGWVFVLLGVSLFSLFPVAMGGHAGQVGDHDFAVDGMIYHLFGAALWVGGLIALIGLAKQGIDHIGIMARRYSTIALVAIIAIALSGIINAQIRVGGPSRMFTTSYGQLVAAKIGLVLVLGAFGYWHRRRTIPQIDGGNTRPLIRLAAVEAAIMAATIGVAATLSRTATPTLPNAGVVPSDVALVIGYELPGPPSIANLLLFWRFDLIAGTVAVVGAGLYIAGVLRLKRRGDTWPVPRTIAWLLGCFTLLWSTSSGMGPYGLSMFSMHMIEHMLLAMLVPIFLVLGGPTTLLLRAVPPRKPGDPPGVREAVLGFVHAPVTKFLTHPLIVMPLFVASFYVLYFTNLFDIMISSHPGHLFMEVHFVLTGYLYYWVIIGIDPAPRRLTYPVKLALVVVAMPFHAFFGLALMSSHQLLGSDWYQRIALEWVPDLLGNQKLGGAIGWGFTEIPLVIVMLALMAQWARSDERQGRQEARKAELDQDADLVAYNNMLAAMAKQDEMRA